MTQEINLQTQKFYSLFKELSFFLDNYGSKSLLYHLQIIGEITGNTYGLDSIDSNSIKSNNHTKILSQLSNCLKENDLLKH